VGSAQKWVLPALEECRTLFQQWLQSLYDYWQFVPTEQQKSSACEQAERLNLSLADRRSYDPLRLHLGKQGVFPLMLTAEEQVSFEYQQWRTENPNASEREQRQQLVLLQNRSRQ